jgi:ABC-2 type transport system permease protein
VRVWAVAAKEFWALVRQPQLVLLLLVGPVIIMAAFGLSLDVRSILLPRVAVVVEPGSEGAELFEQFRYQFENRTSSVVVTDDEEAARGRLLRGDVDAVIQVPPSLSGRFSEGEQAVLDVTYNTINPVFGTAVPERSYSLVSDLNLDIVQRGISGRIGDLRSAREQVDELERRFDRVDRAVGNLASEEARSTTADLDESLAELEDALRPLSDRRGEAGQEASAALEQTRRTRDVLEEVRETQRGGADEIRRQTGLAELERAVEALQASLAAVPDASPEVLANPLRLELENLAAPPGVVGFYTPGVLALIIQHIAVSLASLAVIRERLSGAYEFFEVSPLGPGELLAGQFLTYFGLVLGVNLAVAALLATFLGIPIEGGVPAMVLAMALLTVASLALGFLVSALARSQLQAVQVAMLLLIASAFFTGFLFPLSDMKGPAVALSYLLPTTYGIRSLQDVMLRGEGISTFDLIALVVISAVCLGLSRLLMGLKKV